MWKHCLFWASCLKLKKHWHFWDSKTFYCVYCFKILRKYSKCIVQDAMSIQNNVSTKFEKHTYIFFNSKWKFGIPAVPSKTCQWLKMAALYQIIPPHWRVPRSVHGQSLSSRWPSSDHEVTMNFLWSFMVRWWFSCDHHVTMKKHEKFHGHFMVNHGHQVCFMVRKVHGQTLWSLDCQPWSTIVNHGRQWHHGQAFLGVCWSVTSFM